MTKRSKATKSTVTYMVTKAFDWLSAGVTYEATTTSSRPMDVDFRRADGSSGCIVPRWAVKAALANGSLKAA